MAKPSQGSKDELEALVQEAVRLELEQRSPPKAQRLLNRLSSGQRSASTAPSQYQKNEALIAAVMSQHGLTREKAIRELTLFGGL